jgi:hypothetical protein
VPSVPPTSRTVGACSAAWVDSTCTTLAVLHVCLQLLRCHGAAFTCIMARTYTSKQLLHQGANDALWKAPVPGLQHAQQVRAAVLLYQRHELALPHPGQSTRCSRGAGWTCTRRDTHQCTHVMQMNHVRVVEVLQSLRLANHVVWNPILGTPDKDLLQRNKVAGAGVSSEPDLKARSCVGY